MFEISTLIKRFISEFGSEPIVARAPGRINLIGEHTDYNNGFVMPAAISQSILVAIGKSENNDECTLFSLDYNSFYKFRLLDFDRVPGNVWQNYILGVVAEIQKTGRKISGFNLVFGGNIPIGAGMSSSAALECGCCYALNELFDLGLSKMEMAKMSQMAEHNFTGVKCGIMDQFASMMGKNGNALLLDCKTLDFDYVPVAFDGYSILLYNSNVSHSLASSEYNVRRSQCEKGLDVLQSTYSELQSLRDATLIQLQNAKAQMGKTVYQRCKYVIEENQRVLDFAKALKQNQFNKLGGLLKEAQAGMRYEYEITCPEIDFLADFANSYKGVLGSRMMGGGFGGCTINIIHKSITNRFIDDIKKAYQSRFDLELIPISVEIDDGVRRITNE